MSATCPECGGYGNLKGIACSPQSSALSEKTCRECKGTGVIDERRSADLVEARRRYDDRVARGVSLNEEAARLGLHPRQLADIEHARATADSHSVKRGG